jgi:chromosome segregation ATPase
VKGEGVAMELIRVIRKISQCRSRLVTINQEIEVLMKTELFELKSQVDRARETGQDLLADMAENLDDQIAEAQERLTELKEKLGV